MATLKLVAQQTLEFEVLLDESFVAIAQDKKLAPIQNKKVISIINDFEDAKWRHPKFQSFIWDNIADTALSYRERQSLITQPQSALIEAAKKLRLTDSPDLEKEGSELAEILLYGIMKHHYNALPVTPKIFYKQNTKDYAKGADSVHIVLEGKDDFSLWFGEAKFYNSIEDARLDSIVIALSTALQTSAPRKSPLSVNVRICFRTYSDALSS